MKYLTSIVLLSLLTSAAMAVEKRYVKDELWLPLRTGPGQEYRIIKSLQSGEHLIFVEELADSDYTKVKTDKGDEGFVLTRFLDNEPVAKEKLIFAQRELESLKTELAEVQQQRNQLQQQVTNASDSSTTLQQQNEQLQQDLERITAISENALALDEKAKRLTLRNQDLEIQVEALTAENSQLRSDNHSTYLIYGGALVIIGILAGLILPALRGKRSSSGWV
ncbi:peptide-binding protein [Bacterioplanes sanyensis]|uniref:Peptide-binding protein n=1 Tax=Bacterioplanes sanyensis TaxID=1249553 RepID=A0A222FPE6_9GAMM|nr:TIGR04211 family SH3 domain-containing protein [Bacterioplanes sanyensis]ASP40406.1 peptide-binding protein [Bacterioplanes sanyensis]